jgi:hypothetical protein
MLKKIFFISLLFVGTSCVQLTSLVGNDAARTALTTTGDYVLKEKTGKTSTEHVLSSATDKDCSFKDSSLEIKDICK